MKSALNSQDEEYSKGAGQISGMDPTEEEGGLDLANDYVLPILQKTQVMSSLSIRFKHLKLEVDK